MHNTPKILVKKIDDEYICHIPSLSIISINENIEIAYNEAVSKGAELYHSNDFKKISYYLRKYFNHFILSTFFLILFSLFLQGLSFQIIDHHYLLLKRKVDEELNPKQEKQLKRLEKFDSNMKVFKPYVKTFKRVMNEE